jgi:hypothetical protein
MSSIFRRLRRSSPIPGENARESDRLARESHRTAENDARGHAAELKARDQAAENETRRQASDAEARRQGAENEARRLSEDGG